MKKIHVKKHEKSYSKKSKKRGTFPVRDHDRHIKSSHSISKKIAKSYVGYRYMDERSEERKIHNKNYQKKLFIQKCAEAIMYHTPTLREIVVGYKIASNIYSIWNDFSIISQKDGKVNVAADIVKVGLSMYQVKMMYDLIDNRVPVNEKLDTKKILENVFLDLTKEEISLVFSSI